MSLFTRETVTASNLTPERAAFRSGLVGSFGVHLAALAALSVMGAFAIHQIQKPVAGVVNPTTPATEEGHAQRTAQAKATLEKLTETLNRLEKLEEQTKPSFDKAISEATHRAPTEAVRRLSEATQAQKRLSDALKRGENPKPAQAAVNNAQERAKRAVSLLPKPAQEKVNPLLAEAAKQQAEALKQAAKLAQQSVKQNQPASEAAKQAALAAQKAAEAAMERALAEAREAARAAGASSQQMAKAGDTKEPHAPGEHKPSCFAPGGT